ncbi:DNA gyrase subunit B [Roseiconus nitratireducens]|uniref:DNA topoisomerase (ATP-hydrolyzing) n=1 Tax=Roseiconus nitratireducens TaxID=2605748 RepID=A0A5M6CXX9_9BACT|nr:DNA gyrase subunit B [Roseiconus nitratireducens]KAA5540078.1 DNA gyrase subunit B [Roseiconus nitratireducens]
MSDAPSSDSSAPEPEHTPPVEPTPRSVAESIARTANDAYDSDDLQHLSDLEHVRERPGMYVGDTDRNGLHHLVSEVVDNSIDEAMAGFATTVSVTVHNDGSVTVEDDGRGIPVAKHEQLSAEAEREVSTLEGVMTVLKFGGKFQKGAYQTSGGLHGVGVTVVNFLSQWAEVEVSRDGYTWHQQYERGVAVEPVKRGHATKKTGTKTTFKPDPEIFSTTKFVFDVLNRRLQELAFLNSGVRIKFLDERNGEGGDYKYERGVAEFIEHLNRTSDPIHSDVIEFSGTRDDIEYEIAMQYTTEYSESVQSYVNNIHTEDGGTHVSGFRSALTRTLNNYGRKENLFKGNPPTGDDFREGLTAIISVRVPEPRFQSQTKNKLSNAEVESTLNTVVGESLAKYLEENPRTAKTIVRKALLASEAREAARKAKDLLRKRKDALGGGGLPGKLRDCISKEMDRCELYLVEGDSAGGSAEGGRMRDYQAILPLRGKIINAYKSREDKVLANEEVRSMIQAIGTGIGADQDISKRRYNKIVIMTDADVDGSHIRTLLLCFFYRQMYQLVADGHVYVAQPPLFRVTHGRSKYYVQTEEEMKSQLLDRGLSDTQFEAEDGRRIEGELMRKLCTALASMEDAILALERRGVNLRIHSQRLDPVSNRLPAWHLTFGNEERWFQSPDGVEDFLNENHLVLDDETLGDEAPEEEGVEDEAAGEEAAGGSESEATSEAESEEPPRLIAHLTELHEVNTINSGLKELAVLGFNLEDLIPADRTGLTTPRFELVRGEDIRRPMEDLRELLPEIRAAGEKGLQVTRFKGLGEMNAEELRETTLDPENRTLIKVNMKDAGAADEMFRLLMGDKVEPRREFIEKHALDVRNLDV